MRRKKWLWDLLFPFFLREKHYHVFSVLEQITIWNLKAVSPTPLKFWGSPLQFKRVFFLFLCHLVLYWLKNWQLSAFQNDFGNWLLNVPTIGCHHNLDPYQFDISNIFPCVCKLWLCGTYLHRLLHNTSIKCCQTWSSNYVPAMTNILDALFLIFI